MALPGSGDIFFASISELSAKLRAKEFSAVELTRAYCDRLEKMGPRYNALAHSLRDQAIRKAKDVDDDLKGDRTRSPLQGIPYGAKDLLAVKKQPTTWGSRIFANQVFNEDATVIKKLDKAGAILIGKLSMIELAGGVGYNTAAASFTGPTRNPWGPSRWAGGSSSGPAAATAAGLVAFSLGSETSGSIITPSAYSGVTGLRPTYGLVSRHGAMALAWTLDKIGPMCRTAEDCALVLHAIAGSDSDDPGSAHRGFTYAPKFDRKLSDFTIGYDPADFAERPAPDIRSPLQQAFETMKSLSMKFKEIRIPEFPYGALVQTILGAEAASVFEDVIRNGQIDQLSDASQAASLRAALDISATDYLKAMRIRSLVQQAFRDLFYDVDMVLTPSRMETAPEIAHDLEARGPVPLIPAGNLAGLPALSLPCGFSGDLPVAISLIGRAFFENHLIAVGRAFQSQTDWHRRRPPSIAS